MPSTILYTLGRDVGEDLGHWRSASGNSLDMCCALGTGSHGAAATLDICCHSVTKAAKWLVVERHADTQIPPVCKEKEKLQRNSPQTRKHKLFFQPWTPPSS